MLRELTVMTGYGGYTAVSNAPLRYTAGFLPLFSCLNIFLLTLESFINSILDKRLSII